MPLSEELVGQEKKKQTARRTLGQSAACGGRKGGLTGSGRARDEEGRRRTTGFSTKGMGAPRTKKIKGGEGISKSGTGSEQVGNERRGEGEFRKERDFPWTTLGEKNTQTKSTYV